MVKQRVKDVMVGAIAGTVLGAVTALLLAPKSGRELRTDIAEGYQQVSEKTQQLAAAVTDKTQTVAKEIGSQTSEWFGKAKDATAQVANQVRSWKAGQKEEDAAIAAVAATEETVENDEAAKESDA